MNDICVHEADVESKQLPGRSVKVLTELLPAKNITFGLCEVPPHSAMNPHQHVQEELIWIMDGYGFVNVDGRQERVSPGTLVHFSSNATHFTVNESEHVMRFAFCFSPQIIVGSYDAKAGS
jgi:uncharacterized cupin superfamily protein